MVHKNQLLEMLFHSCIFFLVKISCVIPYTALQKLKLPRLRIQAKSTLISIPYTAYTCLVLKAMSDQKQVSSLHCMIGHKLVTKVLEHAECCLTKSC